MLLQKKLRHTHFMASIALALIASTQATGDVVLGLTPDSKSGELAKLPSEDVSLIDLNGDAIARTELTARFVLTDDEVMIYVDGTELSTTQPLSPLRTQDFLIQANELEATAVPQYESRLETERIELKSDLNIVTTTGVEDVVAAPEMAEAPHLHEVVLNRLCYVGTQAFQILNDQVAESGITDAPPNDGNPPDFVIDPIPEPGSAGLALAFLFALIYRRRRV